MRRIPMILQLALILFFVMSIPAVMLTWNSGSQIVSYSEDAIAEAALARLDANRKLCENALGAIARDTASLSSTFNFNRFRSAASFRELNADYNNITNAQALARELASMKRNMAGVYSLFFHLDGADYVVSSDKGIAKLEDYEDISFLNDALNGHIGISGLWVPRRNAQKREVFSFLMPLSRLTTSTHGTIVVNLEEEQLFEYLKSGDRGERDNMLLLPNGTIVAHSNKSRLLTDGKQIPFVESILEGDARSGYEFHTIENDRLLYTFYRSLQNDWLYISTSSMDELMDKTTSVRMNMIALMAAVLLFGAGIAAVLAMVLSRPARELARVVRSHVNLDTADKNELSILGAAFTKIENEQAYLKKVMLDHQQDTRSLALHSLMDEGVVDTKSLSLLQEAMPAPFFLVVMVSIDSYGEYRANTTPEIRSYHRYLYISQCETLFKGDTRACANYRSGGVIAFVINFEKQGRDRTTIGIETALDDMRDAGKSVFGHSVTIGVSRVIEGIAGVCERANEAEEATRRRLVMGGDSIIYWQQEPGNGGKYTYPENAERRILNHLDAGEIEPIKAELHAIRSDILSAKHISYDNILFIYNQLAAVTIKHLGENNMNTSRLLVRHGHVYGEIAAMDTLVDLENYLVGFFAEIIINANKRDTSNETNYTRSVTAFLDDHFREEIDFEKLASEIGISYSYMRRLIRETTGRSLIDCVNQRRIQEAKHKLLSTNLSILQVAKEVGYNNAQSLNRFFHKYEGMSAGEYRASKTGA